MERFIPIELLSYFALFGSASMKRGNDRINTEKLLSDEFWSFVQKWCGSEALLDLDSNSLRPASQVQVGVAPCPQVSRAAHIFSALRIAPLLGVVNQEDGRAELLLQRAQERH